MTTNRTSWETMQRKQLALSYAKDAKALYACELEKLRFTLEYLRSLQHWITAASSHRTLKARKLALAESMGTAAMMERETAAHTICYWDLVPANCQENIRSAISWARTATSATTFADWQECCDGAGDFIGDVVCQVEVVQSRVKSNWKQARANMISARTVIDTCAKDILHPVAAPKQTRKEAIRNAIMPHTLVPQTVATCNNKSLYALAKYHLGKNSIRELKYGSKLTYGIWSRAITIRSLCRN